MKVTSKGQVTIPKRVRDQLGIRTGTVLEVQVEGDSIRLCKVASREALEEWRGVLNLEEPVDDFVARLRGER